MMRRDVIFIVPRFRRTKSSVIYKQYMQEKKKRYSVEGIASLNSLQLSAVVGVRSILACSGIGSITRSVLCLVFILLVGRIVRIICVAVIAGVVCIAAVVRLVVIVLHNNILRSKGLFEGYRTIMSN